jgi:TonB family protein
MNKYIMPLMKIVVFVFLGNCLFGGEKYDVRVRLFQGNRTPDQAILKDEVVLSASTTPQIASLKLKVNGPVETLTTAAIAALLDVMDLRSVDDLLQFTKKWTGKETSFKNPVMSKRAAFWFKISLNKLSNQTVSLGVIVHRSKTALLSTPATPDEKFNDELAKALKSSENAGLMMKILDRKLVFEIGEPVIVGIPVEGGVYFMMILVSPEDTPTDKEVLIKNPAPVHQVIPAYPEELRDKGVEGQVALQVAIDAEGIVQAVRVTKPLHPYLDNAAVQALRQWRYEPVIKEGKPISVVITVTVDFNEEAWLQEEERLMKEKAGTSEIKPGDQERLRKILDECSAYCQKLADAALDFICEETIKDDYYDFNLKDVHKAEVDYVIVRPGATGVQMKESSLYDPKRTERNKYVCDYQLIKKGGEIKERRLLLEENGQKIRDQKRSLEISRFAVLRPFFNPVKIFGHDRQRLFDYRIVDEERTNGRKSYVIEALPKLGDAGGIEYAKLWVDQKTFQVLKSEFRGIPLEGYEDVLKDSVALNIKPDFEITHLYEVDKKGVLFPAHSKILVMYPLFDPTDFHDPLRGNRLKLSTDVAYKNYKFFTVETEEKIIK